MAFQAPIGTQAERNSGQIWPGTWYDANRWIGNIPPKYKLGKNNWAYHTGADLNNDKPNWDSDAHAEIYSIGDGEVTYAGLVSKKSWGNLVVINHGIVNEKPLFTRYAHVEEVQVQKGQTVNMGTFIAKVSNQFGVFPYHLHFDISTTTQLLNMPTYWPGLDQQGCKFHFVNPQDWLLQHLNVSGQLNVASNQNSTIPANTNTPPRTLAKPIWHVIAQNGLDVFDNSLTTANKSGKLSRASKIILNESGRKSEGFIWVQIAEGNFKDKWVQKNKVDGETYISTNPPQN